jgi:TetR/AcrR family transcriptional regulator, repressor for neighboring sulfatase
MRPSKQHAGHVILDAAKSILLEDALEAARVQRVAMNVGITDAAVHDHFGNHAAVVEALLRHCAKKLVLELELGATSQATERLVICGA